MPTETRAVIEEFLTRVVAGDPDRIAELFADEVDWQLNWPADGHPAVPWIRPRRTRSDVADHFREIAEAHTPGIPPSRAPEILVDGADAVLFAEISQIAKATGRAYTALCALRFTVRDGVITRYHVYEDSLSVAVALGD
ncbi:MULTISPECIES: nuclear transport factor 2 family protein [unclassified Crossiella]|uniref:nuclear transport factor 2 family protein n=1 Tax=unclassified Crossiella TaxID=2620835 RepID=UPI001FFEB31C|nr:MULTISPECIES: nuclear transport factor 2 family protein [unclassified Crossiella]MCK2242259.1 nuclear transport factor 2 family protein [Crossiella sp. S99.2]MCK2254710.1 nuclear transport factor 2 family protein [Crossiella sp. S99.1]